MLDEIKSLIARIGQFWTNTKELAKKDLSVLWSEYRTPLIILGSLILALKFRQWLIDFIVSGSKELFDNAQKKDQKLQNQENTANQQADALVNTANELSDTEKTVDSDWYKK
jgi:hypothetical protein